MHDQAETVNLLSVITNIQSAEEYKELNWEGFVAELMNAISRQLDKGA